MLHYILRYVQIDARILECELLQVLATIRADHASQGFVWKELTRDVVPAFSREPSTRTPISGRRFVDGQRRPVRKALLDHLHQGTFPRDAAAAQTLVVISQPSIASHEGRALLADRTPPSVLQHNRSQPLLPAGAVLACLTREAIAPFLQSARVVQRALVVGVIRSELE
jgi:hypothetical protein